jgi:hypothetical protein
VIQYAGLMGQVMRNIDALQSKRVVLWTHSGLGDQISASRIVESLLNSNVEVLWPVMARNIQFMTQAFSEWEGLSLIPIDDSAKENTKTLAISLKYRARIVNVGHRHLSKMQSLFPEFSLNSIFNLFIGLEPLDLVSKKLRSSLAGISQLEIPSKPFAFLDHHPKTYREIPPFIFDSIFARGLTLIENPRNSPLASTINLLDNAAELHLVNSAPLCLAQTIDAKAARRVHYDSRRDPVHKSYPRWESISITGSEHMTHFIKSVEPTQESENVRAKILQLIQDRTSREDSLN